MERSFVMIKPDAVRRKLIGKILNRFEDSNINILSMKMMNISRELAETHYGEHKGKEFFENLLSFMTSGSVVAMVLEGKDVVSLIRKMVGATDPAKADKGTIRGDLKEDPVKTITENMIHASDSTETAKREIALFFKDFD